MKKVDKRWWGLVVVTLALGACGGDDSSGNSSASTESAPTTPTEAPSDAPRRIVSLSPSHTEMLFAIGAGDQVVAVDSL